MSIHQQAEIIVPALKYEWCMFQWIANRIMNEGQNINEMERNTLLEGFLLHARVLRDFFIATPQGDDVSARHFFDDPSTWENRAGNLCTYLRQNRTRLNKMLAHFTYSRITELRDWDISTIINELFQAWQQFYSALPQEQQRWFNNS